MAQQKYQGNLSSASFPLASVFKGPSVIIPNRDQSSGPFRDFSGETTQLGMNIAQLYYAENVVPTNEGYQSVAYNPFIAAASGATGSFTDLEVVFDGDSNKAMIGVTSAYEIWILSQYTPGGWQKITLPGGATWSAGILTVGIVYGVVYVNLQGLGVYRYDISGNVFVKETILGATDADFIGITDTTSYLIAYNETDVLWSSTTNPLDFVPSIITGAGGGTPEGLKGQIVFCKEISKGFIVYTNVMMMSAQYSGNTQYPFVFIPLAGGAGIKSKDSVGDDMNISSHYAWTVAGLLEVNVAFAKPMHEEVTDYFSSGIWEVYDPISRTVTTTKTSTPFTVRVTVISSRYLVISYGQTNGDVPALSYALLYDLTMKRWGKCARPHTVAFEIVADTAGGGITWDGTAPNEWEDYPIAWSSLTRFTNSTPEPKNTLGFLAADGSISYVDFNQDNDQGVGVAILGKFQLTRTSLSQIEELVIENADQSNENFNVYLQHTLDGKNPILPVTTPHLYYSAPNLRHYLSRLVGQNHSIIVTGSFNLVSYVLTLHNVGRR